MYRILLVEDDPTIAGVVAKELEGWGYEVRLVEDFGAVMALFERFAPQLVLMDLGLPRYNGFHWCCEIRKISQAPIIFISSAADSMNLITALHHGADDFIAKPFDLSILIAKVQAMLRRTYSFGASPELLYCGGLSLDVASAAVLCEGQTYELTRNELRILELLLQNKGRVVSREAIMRKLWDDENFIDDNTLTVNVTRLRKTLEQAGLPGFIQTKKGLGYTIQE